MLLHVFLCYWLLASDAAIDEVGFGIERVYVGVIHYFLEIFFGSEGHFIISFSICPR